MVTIRLLEEIDDLRLSRYGQPSPRHGLQLLHWFATKYIEFDNNNQIIMKFNPMDGLFGFHRFQNRTDSIQEGRLLPNQSSPYYEVGNLHSHGAEGLPVYVRKKWTGYIDGSNTDRLIIGLNSDGNINKVYVTQHENQRKFSHDHTYQVSESLLYEIHNISSCETFLGQVLGRGESRSQRRQTKDYVAIDMDDNSPTEEAEQTFLGQVIGRGESRSQRRQTQGYVAIDTNAEQCCPCCIIL